MNTAQTIVSKFGSQSRLARLLNEAGYQVGQTTVSLWCRSGFIPARRQAQVLEAASIADINIRPEDFFQASAQTD